MNGGKEAPNKGVSWYLMHISLHGLVRGEDIELGRDADTGGQIQYVIELVRALAKLEGVDRVDLLTRRISDPRISEEYRRDEELLDKEGLARIVRIPFGPRRYLRKERFWPYLDCFVDSALQYIRRVGRVPDVIHAHYADAGQAGARLASLLGVPFVFTGHSLGREKLRLLRERGQKDETIERRYQISKRIEAEEDALDMASLVVASTRQEVENQYALYDNHKHQRVAVIPPGVDISRFHPVVKGERPGKCVPDIERFLRHPKRPWILALARADEKKNLSTLVHAFGRHTELRFRANLVLFAGVRERISELEKAQARVWRELLELIDDYDLYGHIAYPKQHTADDVPCIYRGAAASGGVFVNPAWTEPFGLTLIEAAASGLPVIATDDGGPQEILRHCRDGVLIDPHDAEELGNTLNDALGNRRRWRQWSQRGMLGVRRHYTWTGHAESYLREVKKISRQHQRRRVSKSRLPTVQRILICDIDNTLLGDYEALGQLIETIKAAGDGMAFGVATGRRLESTVHVLKEWKVPMPDLFITAVGSEVHYGPSPQPDHEWNRHIDFRWDREAIYKTLNQLPGLSLQPDSEQRMHKVSYYADADLMPGVPEIRRALRRNDVHANVIFSHQAYIDILPIRASKGQAVRYVADRWGVSMDHVLVAGDSGNDEEMLLGQSLGVVVGNHSPELETLKGRKLVYFAHASHAAGILEGIVHYQFLEGVL